MQVATPSDRTFNPRRTPRQFSPGGTRFCAANGSATITRACISFSIRRLAGSLDVTGASGGCHMASSRRLRRKGRTDALGLWANDPSYRVVRLSSSEPACRAELSGQLFRHCDQIRGPHYSKMDPPAGHDFSSPRGDHRSTRSVAKVIGGRDRQRHHGSPFLCDLRTESHGRKVNAVD